MRYYATRCNTMREILAYAGSTLGESSSQLTLHNRALFG
jgi:hypothetical protein